MGKPKIPAEQRAAFAAQAEQMKSAKNIEGVDLQELKLRYPELAQLLEAEELGPSALEDVQTDPRLKETQMQALQSIRDRAEQGLTSEDKLAMEQMLSQTDAAAKSRQQGLMQEMARRGTLDSGASLAASLAGQQGAATNARQQAMQMAAQSSANRLQAAQQMGNMAGQMEQADYSRGANLASAKDRIAQANAAARMQVNQQNVAARQAIQNQKTALQNQETMYNISRDQQRFNNELAKAGAAQSATNAYANMASQIPQGGGRGQLLGTLAGAGIGAMVAGPGGALKGAQAGAGFGGAAGGLLLPNFENGGVIHAENGVSGYDTMSFADAYNKARQFHGGGGGTFKWRGKLYNTNDKGETNPVDMSVVDESGGIQNSSKPTQQINPNELFDFKRMENDVLNSSKIENGKVVGKPTGAVQAEGYGDDKTATEITQPQKEEKIEDKSMSDEDMAAIGNIAKMATAKPAQKQSLNLNTNVQFAQPQNVLAQKVQPQQFANPFAAQDGGTYYQAEDGDVMYKSDGNGDVVDGDSFAGDRVDAKLNSGEMVLNVSQQQRLMDLLRGKAKPEDLGDKDIVEGVPREYQEKLKAKANFQNGGTVRSPEAGTVLSPEELAMYQTTEEEAMNERQPSENEMMLKQALDAGAGVSEDNEMPEDIKQKAIAEAKAQMINEEAKSPYMKETSKEEPFSVENEYQKLLQEYNKRRQEKPDNSTLKGWAAAADILNQAAANYNPYYRPMKGSRLEDIQKEEQSSKAQDLGQISAMAQLLDKYRGTQESKDGLSLKDQLYLDYYNRSLEQRKKAQEDIIKRQQASFGQKDIDRKRSLEKDIEGLINKYESNSTVKELEKQGLSFEQVDQLIDQMKQGNSVALGSLGTKMARAMGEVGVLTESDVTRYTQAQKLVQRAKDMYGRNFEGKLSKQTIKDIQDVTNKMKQGFETKRKKLYDRYVKRAYELYGKDAGLKLEDIETRFAMPAMSKLEKSTSPRKSEYSDSQERGIERVMKANSITREQAIKALKDAGKL